MKEQHLRKAKTAAPEAKSPGQAKAVETPAARRRKVIFLEVFAGKGRLTHHVRKETSCKVLPADEFKKGGSDFRSRKSTALLRQRMTELRKLEDEVAFIGFKAECREEAAKQGKVFDEEGFTMETQGDAFRASSHFTLIGIHLAPPPMQHFLEGQGQRPEDEGSVI